MSDMNTVKPDSKEMIDSAQEDYRENFVPRVHRIGRSTMAISLVLAFLPTLYFLLVKGYVAPISNYINVAIAVCGVEFGMWLTEPLAYWPALGSAGTYIGYLSGNVGAMRFPVALSLQSAMKADINTPRGQVVTIIGIVASVFSNLVLLLIFVLAGSWLTRVLPEVILSSFSFVLPGLIGSMLFMRWGGEEHKFANNFISSLPYLIVAIAVKWLTNCIAALMAWGIAIAVGLCVLIAYFVYKHDCKMDEAAKAKG